MKARKIVLATLLSASTASLFAQSGSTGGVSFDIRAGVNFTNVNGENAAGTKYDNKLRTGFHIGVDAEIPVAPEFYFAPGLLFSTKGANGNASGDKLSLNYLELPLNFLYKGTLGTGKLRLGLGPYIALGLSGTNKSGPLEMDVKFKSEAENAANTVYYKPIDAGANLLAGYEFSNKVFAQLNAQLGLVNLNAYNTDAKQKNTGFGVSVGYRF